MTEPSSPFERVACRNYEQTNWRRDQRLFRKLAHLPGSTLTESIQSVRIDNVTHHAPELVVELKAIASQVEDLGLGELELFAEVAGRLRIANVAWDDIEGESLTIVLERPPRMIGVFSSVRRVSKVGWKGFRSAVKASKIKKCIEVTGDFSEFSTFLFSVKPFGREWALSEFKQAPKSLASWCVISRNDSLRNTSMPGCSMTSPRSQASRFERGRASPFKN